MWATLTPTTYPGHKNVCINSVGVVSTGKEVMRTEEEGGEEGGKYSSIAVKEERDVKKKKQRRSREREVREGI